MLFFLRPSMEASARLVVSAAALHRHSKPSHHFPVPHLRFPSLSNSNSLPYGVVPSISYLAAPRTSSASCRLRPVLWSTAALPYRKPQSLAPFGSVPQFCPWIATQYRALAASSDSNEGAFDFDQDWTGADGDKLGSFGGKEASWTVVLLGWLGAERKHLKKYAELYSSKGIRPVRFVVPMKEILWFDLGKRVEERIAGFARDLASWCSEEEKDGRERRLIFHTFSNTGWLSYGIILENLQSRPDIIEKIKGCVIDSGPAPEISPRIWAAGFSAALLKKRSSLIYTTIEDLEAANTNGNPRAAVSKDTSSSFYETLVLALLEKFFGIVLTLPDVNLRLRKVNSILSSKQPLCPQLYLYSSADKVIPASSVDNFIKVQKALGRDVYAHDFVLSPHVDHLRSYPQIYASKIEEFLRVCRRPGVGAIY